MACDGGCVSPCDPGPGGVRAVEGDESEMRTTRRCYIASIVLQLLTIIITRSHAPNKCTTDKSDRGTTSYFPMSSSHLNTLKQSYISKMIAEQIKSEHGNPFHKQLPGPCFRGLVKFDKDY